MPLQASCDQDMIVCAVVSFVFSCSSGSDRGGIVAMDERMVEAIARRAGLEKALEAYPDDVAAAATSAEKATDRIHRSRGTLSEPLSEPWPPMIVIGR